MKQRLVAGSLLATAVLAMVASVALGHASLVSSDPADGATIKTPYTLTATFSEDISPSGSSIIVQAANGKQVANGTVSTTDNTVMTIDLPALPDGTYTVLWTSVTPDDNGVERGTYHFITSSAAATAPATPAPSGAPGRTTGSGNDLLIALVLAAVIIVAMLGFVLYRTRRR